MVSLLFFHLLARCFLLYLGAHYFLTIFRLFIKKKFSLSLGDIVRTSHLSIFNSNSCMLCSSAFILPVLSELQTENYLGSSYKYFFLFISFLFAVLGSSQVS
jgi:hypothetical protein